LRLIGITREEISLNLSIEIISFTKFLEFTA